MVLDTALKCKGRTWLCLSVIHIPLKWSLQPGFHLKWTKRLVRSRYLAMIARLLVRRQPKFGAFDLLSHIMVREFATSTKRSVEKLVRLEKEPSNHGKKFSFDWPGTSTWTRSQAFSGNR